MFSARGGGADPLWKRLLSSDREPIQNSSGRKKISCGALAMVRELPYTGAAFANLRVSTPSPEQLSPERYHLNTLSTYLTGFFYVYGARQDLGVGLPAA